MSIKFNMYVKTEKQATTILLAIKVSDRFCGYILDEEGETIHEVINSYVPEFFPGNHLGDYLELNIDLETGLITNWKKPTSEDLEELTK